MPVVSIRPMRDARDAAAFQALNEEWIQLHFTLEARDREVLSDPESTILRRGGYIFILDGEAEAIGCVALIPMGDGVYELSKMAISPDYRGRGYGRALLQYAVEQAKEIGAKSLFLGSSKRLENAVHLYESLGFTHVPPEKIPPMPYSRANVFMEMQMG